MTEIIATSNAWRLERPYEIKIMKVYRSTTDDRHSSIVSELIKAHREDWIWEQTDFTVAVLKISHSKAIWIGCEYRHFTCVAAMEHPDHRRVPVFGHSMVTVNRHLVSLTVIVTLDHMPCVVNILRVGMPYVL